MTKHCPSLANHLRPATTLSTDPKYLAYKTRKIKTGIEQAKDRTQMIPVRKIWEDFDF